MTVSRQDAHEAIIIFKGLMDGLESTNKFLHTQYVQAHQQAFMLKIVAHDVIVNEDLIKFYRLLGRLRIYEEEVSKGLRR